MRSSETVQPEQKGPGLGSERRLEGRPGGKKKRTRVTPAVSSLQKRTTLPDPGCGGTAQIYVS